MVMTGVITISDDRISTAQRCLDASSPTSIFEDAHTDETADVVAGSVEQLDKQQQQDAGVISDYEDAIDMLDANVKKGQTSKQNNPMPTNRSCSEFRFGPYVPILRRNNQIIIDSAGIVDHHFESGLSDKNKQFEVLPDDSILDAPSLVTPLLLKKNTVWPRETEGSDLSVNHMIDKSNQEKQSQRCAEDFNDVEIIKIVNKESTNDDNNCPAGEFTNNLTPNVSLTNATRLDELIKTATIASLTHTKSKSNNKSIFTIDDYFGSSVGKLLQSIGLSMVNEFNLERTAKRLTRAKRQAEQQGKDNSNIVSELKSIQENLTQAETNNRAFKSKQVLKCNRCEFETDSLLVLNGHLEVLHKYKRDHLCSWCDYKTYESSRILLHCFIEHKKRCRTEKSSLTFQCRYCPYENRLRTKLEIHLQKCEETFPHRAFLGPVDYYDEDNYPGITSKQITQRDIVIYEQTLQTLRLSAYNPHHIKVAGCQQPIMVVVRQSGPHISRSINELANKNARKDYMRTQACRVNNDPNMININQRIADEHHTAQLMDIISAQNNYPNQSRASIIQYPKSQSSLMNVRSVIQGATDFVMPPTNSSTSSVICDGTTANSNIVRIKTSPKTKPRKATFVICEICDGYIKDLSQLKSHMERIHNVKIHQKVLLSRPPLDCQKCQWRFFTDEGLERHLLGAHGLVTSNMQERVEQGVDSGRCTLCGSAFANKLVAHLKMVHKITLKLAQLSYKCTVCAASFNLYRLFENHVYTVHSDSLVNK